MGRGDDDILYNPPKIRKHSAARIAHLRLPEPARQVLASENNIFFLDQSGHISLLNNDMKRHYAFSARLPEDGLVACRGDLLAWKEGGGVFLEDASDSSVHFCGKPGINLLGLHIGNDYLFTLVENESGHKEIARTDIQGEDPKWGTMYDYASLDSVHLLQKGPDSLLYYEQESVPTKMNSLVTLSPDGPSAMLSTFHTTIEKSNHGRLVAPAGMGEYFALGKTWHNEPALLLLRSYSKEEGIGGGRAGEIPISYLRELDIKSEEFFDIAVNDKSCFLLGEEELLIFDRQGLQDTISVRGLGYNRLCAMDKEVLLWREGFDRTLLVQPGR